MKTTIKFKSYITLMFSNDGKMILPKNNDGEYDVIMHLEGKTLGASRSTEPNNKSLLIVNGDEDYKRKLSHYIASLLNDRTVSDLEMFVGNSKYIVDCGTYSIDIQLKELANADFTSFIRIADEDIGMRSDDPNKELINMASIRYMVLGNDVSLDQLSGVEFISLEELPGFIASDSKKTDYLRLMLSGIDLERVKKFSSTLSSYHEEQSPFSM